MNGVEDFLAGELQRMPLPQDSAPGPNHGIQPTSCRARLMPAFDEQGMRKEYDFSKGVRRRARIRPPTGIASGMPSYRDSDRVADELTSAQMQELRRRMADFDDVTRYLLVSEMGPRFALYYNVSDDVYVMNDPRGATLFKRRKTALAVKALLGGSIRILRCKSKRVNGVRVPMLGTTRSGRTTVRRSSSNKRLQPTAGTKRSRRKRRRSTGRG